MTTKKTVRVPVAADGVPVVAAKRDLEKTRELLICEASSEDERDRMSNAQAAPQEVVNDEVTVPVQSSIESTLTFEVLRRQSTEEDEDEEAKK